ncbi:MAG: insulinase family protein [Thermoplasmata archaeon]|nr:insulinase family protein [Thermoplasmata archaeon]
MSRSGLVDRFSLPNGLEVILAPTPRSPTVSVWVWYRVGSKNEWPGVTGASHWVEHMLFLGSPRYRKGEIDRAVIGVGGRLNAFTGNVFTAYFSTVPREHLAIPLRIEADRMTRALLAPAEVTRERTVIRSEREGAENWPEFRVSETVDELAFRRHPYRWSPLGYPEDILALTQKDLAAYYHRFYGTSNAVLVVAGGFDRGAVTRTIRRRFGPLPRTGEDPTVSTKEPPATGERRARLSGPGSTPSLTIGWRQPGIADRRIPAIAMLDVILGGETALFRIGRPWGSSGEHPSARLYRALVDSGLAVSATSSFSPRIHPGTFTIDIQAAKGITLERLEEAVLRETERIARAGVTRREMDDARVKVRRGAELAYEGAGATGFRLGYFAMLGPKGFERALLRAILRVRASDVQVAARELFESASRVVVGYDPTGDGSAG